MELNESRDVVALEPFEFPDLPGPVARIAALLLDPSASAGEVADAILHEPALADRILGLVDGTFPDLPGRVTSVKHAVALLGFRALRNAVLALGAYDALGTPDGSGLDAALFWRHSVAVAGCARFLARTLGASVPEEAWTAGLLHDAGKPAMARSLGPRYASTLAKLQRGGRSHLRESLHFEIGHDEVGAALAERWTLPATLVQAIRYHHELPASGVDPMARDLAAIVAAADFLCWDLGFPSVPAAAPPIPDPEVLERIDFFRTDRRRLAALLEEEVARAAAAFPLATVARATAEERPAGHAPGLADAVSEEAEAHALDAGLLGRLVDELRVGKDLRAALRQLLVGIRDGFAFDRAYLFLADPIRARLALDYLVSARGAREPKGSQGIDVGDGSSPIAGCLRSREPFLIQDTLSFPGASRSTDRFGAVGGVPVVVGSRTVAVLVVSNEDTGQPLTAAAFDGLRHLATEIALAVENHVLATRCEESDRLARVDELTGLANRRQALEILQREVATTTRTGSPLSVVMIDLDRFKYYNDTFGHAAGDGILRDVADLLRRNVRARDTCARLGGDEFVVILPDTPRPYAQRVAEKLRAVVERLGRGLRLRYPAGRLSLSAGIAAFGQPCRDAAALLDQADQALYRAKRGGRGRVSG